MKLSVCLFAYNHEQFIAEAIQSVLAQNTSFDFEIVIGEDCSTDKTKEVIQKFKNKYPNRINSKFNSRNLGLMPNNINTILRCKGQYIALLDGDDFWIDRNKLQAQVHFLDANPLYSFCFHDAKILKEDGSFSDQTCCGNHLKREIFFEDIIFDVSVPTCSIIFRREAIANFPPQWFKSLHAPDRPLNLLLAHEGKGYYFNKCWGTYRIHKGGSWTRRSYQNRWLTFLQIFKVVNNHFDNKYKKYFSPHQNKIYYQLALALLKDKKPKRAHCFVKKYISSNEDELFDKAIFYSRVISLKLLYFKVLLGRKFNY